MYFYNRIVRVSRNRESWQNQGQRTPDQSTADVNPSTNIRVSNNLQRNDISSERLYNSGAPMASNIGDNSDNLIDNFHPENTVIPKDYLFLLKGIKDLTQNLISIIKHLWMGLACIRTVIGLTRESTDRGLRLVCPR